MSIPMSVTEYRGIGVTEKGKWKKGEGKEKKRKKDKRKNRTLELENFRTLAFRNQKSEQTALCVQQRTLGL